MEDIEMKERVRKVVNEERCKHGMIFEYCAHCNVHEIPREYKFPLEGYDDETGEEYTAWIRGVTMDKYYYKYRVNNGKYTPLKRQTTKPKDLGYRVRTVDSAITRVRF